MATPAKKKDNVLSAIAKINAIQTVALHTNLISTNNLSKQTIINKACEDAKVRLKNLTNGNDTSIVDKIVYDVSTILVKAIRNDDLDYENEENKLKLQAAVADIDTMIAINDENEATIALKEKDILTLQATEARLTKELEKMTKKHAQADAELTTALSYNEFFIAHIEELNKKQTAQTAEIAVLTQERNDALDKIRKLDAQILKLIEKKKKAVDTIDQYKGSIATLNLLNTKLNDVNTKNTEQLERLQTRLQEQLDLKQGEEIAKHLAEITKLNQEIEELKINQLTNENAQIEKLNKNISFANDVNRIHKNSITTQYARIEQLEKEVINKQAEIASVKAELEQRLNDVENERDQLRTILEQITAENKDMIQLAENAATIIQRLTQENAALQQENAELTIANKALRNLNNSVNTQFSGMRAELSNPDVIALFGKYRIDPINGKYNIKNYVNLLINISAENEQLTGHIDGIWRQYADTTKKLDEQNSTTLNKLEQINDVLASQTNQIESNYQNLINILNVLFSKDGEGSTLLFTIQQAANSGNLKRMINNYTTHIQPMIDTINQEINKMLKNTKNACNKHIQDVIDILPENSGLGLIITTPTHSLKSFLKKLLDQDVIDYTNNMNEFITLRLNFIESNTFKGLSEYNQEKVTNLITKIEDTCIREISKLREYINVETLKILQKYIQSSGVTTFIDDLQQLNLQFSITDGFTRCIKYYTDIKKIYDNVVRFIETDDKSFDVTQNDRQMINDVMEKLKQAGKAIPNATILSVKMFIRAMYKSAFEIARNQMISAPVEHSTVYTFKDVGIPNFTIQDNPPITPEQITEFENLLPFHQLFYTWLFSVKTTDKYINHFIQDFFKNLVNKTATSNLFKNNIVSLYLNNKYDEITMYNMIMSYHKNDAKTRINISKNSKEPLANSFNDMMYLLISKQEFLLYLKLYLISQLLISKHRPINKSAYEKALPDTEITININKLSNYNENIWSVSKEFFYMFNDFVYKIFYLTRFSVPNAYNINITIDDRSGIDALIYALENYSESVTAEIIRNNKPLPLFNYIGTINDMFDKITEKQDVKGGAYGGNENNITNSAIVAAGLSIGTILYYGFSGLIIFILIMVIYYLCSKIYKSQISRDVENTSGFHSNDPFGYSGGVLLHDIYKPLNYSGDYMRDYQEGMSSYYSYPQIGPAIYT